MKRLESFANLNRDLFAHGIAVVASLLVFTAGGSYFGQKERLRLLEKKIAANQVVESHTKGIERLVEHAVTSVTLLSSVLQTDMTPGTLGSVAESLLRARPGISGLLIESDGKRLSSFRNNRLGAMAYPPESGQVRLDDYLRSGRLSPVGTPELSISTNQMQFSQILHFVSREGQTRMWGHVIATVDLQQLTEAANIEALAHRGYDYHLNYLTADQTKSLSIAQTKPLLSEKVSRSITLQNGDVISLRIQPRGGWGNDPFFYAELTLVVVASLLLGVFLDVLLRTRSPIPDD